MVPTLWEHIIGKYNRKAHLLYYGLDYAQAYVMQYTLILTNRTQNWIFVHNGIPYSSAW